MTMPASLAGEVEEAVSGSDPARRVEMLRRVTRLFVDQAPSLKDLHVEVFDEVLLRLARNLEFRARVGLAGQIASIDNAPPAVINDLARDDNIQVAQPILERSTRLTEDDLADIAAQKGQGHLLALSRRDVLTPRVTDILVDRGNTRVVHSVVRNEGACFSERAFSQLLEKAREDMTLQSVMRDRTDLPPEAMKRLVAIARERVRETLASEMGEGADAAIHAAVGSAAAALEQAADPALGRDLSDALREAMERANAHEVSEETVATAIRHDRTEEALAGMAHLANTPIGMLISAYNAQNYDPLLIVARSLGFGWGTFKLILTHKAGRELPEPILTSAFESFQTLSVGTAARVVHFAAVRDRAASGEAA